MIFGIRERWSAEKFTCEAKNLLTPLYRFALRLTGQHTDAEDLVQDTILKAFQAYDRSCFDGKAGMRAWVFQILTNTFRDRYRRNARSPEVQFPVPEHDPDSNVIELIPSPEPGPAHLAERKQILEAIQTATDSLPPEVRLAIALFFVEGCSYQEIAEITECPIGTVMSRLSNGRITLRKKLSRFLDENPKSPTSTGLRRVCAGDARDGDAS